MGMIFRLTGPNPQCEKHAKKEEAVAKLRDGAKFDEVAREFSEDKARQGKPPPLLFFSFLPSPSVLPLPFPSSARLR